MQQTLPTLAEDVIESVVQSVKADIDWLVDQFIPDGRAFGQEKRTEKEQLQAYVNSGLRDNPEVAANWIREKVSELTQMMQQFDVPPDLAATVHPYDIVIRAGLVFSAKMEKLLAEHANPLIEQVAQAEAMPPPTAPMTDMAGESPNAGY